MTLADVFCRIPLLHDNHVVIEHAVEGQLVGVKLTTCRHRRLIAAALRNGGLSDPPSFDG
jgi:hypothetical protein